MLPASQEYAEREKQRRTLEKQAEKLNQHLKNIQEEYEDKYPVLKEYPKRLDDLVGRVQKTVERARSLSNALIIKMLEVAKVEKDLLPFKKELVTLQTTYELKYWSARLHMDKEINMLKTTLQDVRYRMKRLKDGRQDNEDDAGPSTSEPTKPKQTFVRACPVDNCRGFLSSGWKCGMCNVNVCAKCHEVKEKDDDGKLKEHTCKPENVETAKLLAKEAKPCPSCSAVISKVSGCDQMWCTQCHTAFSWQTGAIVKNGVIHNPHFFEYMMKNGRDLPRAAGDVPCGGLPYYYAIIQGKDRKMQEDINRMYQGIAETIELRNKYAENRMNDNMDIRVRYLLGDFDEARFKQLLQMRAKANDKVLAIHQVLETFITVGIGFMQDIARARNSATVQPIMVELEELRKYITESLEKVSKIFDCKVPQITEQWQVIAVGQRKK